MKKIIIMVVITSLSFTVISQNVWQVDGNNLNKNLGKIGTTNNKDVQIITNNQPRINIDKAGKVDIPGILQVHGALGIGNNTTWVVPNSGSQSFGNTDYVVSTHARLSLGFGSAAVAPVSPTDFAAYSNYSLSVGGSHHSYKLHVEEQGTMKPALIGFTNNATGHTTGNGFVIGLPTTGNEAVISQQSNAPILFNTNALPRMILDQQGFLGIGNYTAFTPKTWLHIHDDRAHTFWQITNTNTTDAANRGLLMGLIGNNVPDLNDAFIFQQEDRNFRIFVGWTAGNPTERIRIVGLHNIEHVGKVGIGTGFSDIMQPKRRLDVFDPGIGDNGDPQLRLSQELNTNNWDGSFTDFQTTGETNNNYVGAWGLEGGHLLINPRCKAMPRTVAINMENNNTPVFNDLSLDVNGQVNIRSADEDVQEVLTQVLMRDENNNGRVMWRDISTIGGTGLDFDWEHLPEGVFSGHPNIGGFNDRDVYVGYQPVNINQIPLPAKFAVFYDEGGVGNLPFPGSLTSYFHNNYSDPFALTYSTAAAVTGISDGIRCTSKGTNIGGFFRATNAMTNIGGFFTTEQYNCGNQNFAIWAETNPQNGFAGWFVGNVRINGHASYITQGSVSDSIFKQNIQYYNGALEKISNLNPCTFDFKVNNFPTINFPTGNQFGFISQEVETVFPDLVSSITLPAKYDSLGNLISDTITYKELNYNGLIPILAQGIKELAEITDSLSNLPQGGDKDWEHIAGTGVFSGHQNNDGYNNESVFVGFPPAWVPYLETPVKLGVYADQGGIGTNNEYGLVTAGFRNMMVHSNSPNSVTNAYGVFSDSRGDGCNIRTSSNYGIRAQADNAKNNYGGFFRAYAQNMCSFNNYAVYADCPIDDSKNNFAGYFNGNLAYTGNLSFQSDIMLKENVVPVSNAIDVLNQLNPVSFSFKTAQFPTMNMPAGTHFGLIAQEVEPVIPEVVSSNFFPAQYDDNGIMLSDTFSYKSIDYTKLIPHMIEAIKELSQQNQDLQNQLTQMQDIIASCCNEARSSSVNVTIETRPVVVPAQNTTLNQNYPNPFKTITTFNYTLGESGNCELVIEDTYGRTVATLVSEPQQTGNYSVEWEASSQPAGLYFYSLRVNGKVLVKKAIKIE